LRRAVVSCIVPMLILAVLPAAAVGSQPRHDRARTRPELAPAGGDGLTKALEDGRLSRAEYALRRAESLFRPRATSPRASGTDPHLATLYLRDLAAHLGDLDGDDRRRGRRLLARPTDGAADPQETGYRVPPEEVRKDCTEDFCIHWVETTEDAPDISLDVDANGIPDWIDTMRTELTTVWTRFRSLGFREPKSDLSSANNGGDDRLDVYVMNLFPKGMYGYCATDDPNVINEASRYPYFDTSAYCVLENDYAEYPMPGLPSLQVTAAHELFHAVQYAYDAFEDVWFLEGTAVWMEDEIHDDINDHLQYLRASHMATPQVPLDNGDFEAQPYPYGSFLFWRFLTESPVLGGDPPIIREIWERADASPLGPHRAGFDDYSLLAVEKEVAQRGVPFGRVMSEFATFNYVPEAFYEEGAAYLARLEGRRPPPSKDVSVTQWGARKSGRAVLDHLTSAYASFRPGSGVRARRANLTVRVDGPSRTKGTRASILVLRTDGTFSVRAVPLDAAGDGKLWPTFARGKVERIVLVLTNASTRFRDPCYQGITHFSCGGAIPLDDDEVFSFVVRLRQ
jgi:hypothetical protein